MKISEYISKVLSICKIGKKFSTDPYALENYQDLETLSLEMLQEQVDETITGTLYERDIYPTPNISVRTLVINELGELLMVQEKADGLWSVPGGWCDVFESSSSSAIKEVEQEAGVTVEIKRLLGLFSREKYKNYESMLSEYVVYYHGIPLSHDLRPNHEIEQVRYFSIHDLPPLSRKVSLGEITRAYRVYHENSDTQFD